LVAAIINKKQGKKSITNTTKKPVVSINQLSLDDIRKLILELIQERFDQYITKKDKCKCPTGPTGPTSSASNDFQDDDDNFMDIDLTRVEENQESKDLATVKGKINGHEVSVVLDSASNKDLMPRSIADKFGLQRNSEARVINIRGVTGKDKFSESTVATVFLTPECKIKMTFVIADDYPIPEIILGRTTLKRYNYDLFESKDHASISYNGKNFFIPIVPDENRQRR
jgi:gag-polyprotein putative aspartyl protease